VNRSYMKKVIVSICVCLMFSTGIAHAVSAPEAMKVVAVDLDSLIRIDRIDPIKELAYKYPDPFVWGDCSWVDQVALAAGWLPKHLEKVKMIAARESGCCPNRKGGDKVDRNCRITGVSEWNHRSDTGLMQLNGVHWLESHKHYAGLFCKKHNICSKNRCLMRSLICVWQKSCSMLLAGLRGILKGRFCACSGRFLKLFSKMF
jgi:hypothetical protein